MQEDPIDIQIFLAAIGFFATEYAPCQFQVDLSVKKAIEHRPEPFRAALLRDKTPVEMRTFHVKGKGRFRGHFHELGSSFVSCQDTDVVESRFKVDYTVHFLKAVGSDRFQVAYPLVFPKWISSSLFTLIFKSIIWYDLKRVQLDLDCSLVGLKKDNTAEVHVGGWMKLEDFNKQWDIAVPLRITLTDCKTTEVRVQLPGE